MTLCCLRKVRDRRRGRPKALRSTHHSARVSSTRGASSPGLLTPPTPPTPGPRVPSAAAAAAVGEAPEAEAEGPAPKAAVWPGAVVELIRATASSFSSLRINQGRSSAEVTNSAAAQRRSFGEERQWRMAASVEVLVSSWGKATAACNEQGKVDRRSEGRTTSAKMLMRCLEDTLGAEGKDRQWQMAALVEVLMSRCRGEAAVLLVGEGEQG